MSRILIPVGDTMLQHSTIEFAAYIATQMNSDINIIPLDTSAELTSDIPETVEKSAGIGMVGLHLAEATNHGGHYHQQLIEKCRKSFGGYNVQVLPVNDDAISFTRFLQGTRYADLIIVEGNLSPESGILETNPTHYVKELLHHAECPVIIAPLSYQMPNEVLFAFDGSTSSMFAIRQFVRLFPGLCKKKLYVLEVRQEQESITEDKSLAQWIAANFPDFEFIALQGNADNGLLEYALVKHHSIMVMGGYGRNNWSRLLRPSTTAAVVKIVASPIFIAHN